MLTRKSALGLLVGAALTATIFAASTAAQKPAVTVGDFAVQLSKALGKPVSNQRAAVDSLKSLGVQVGTDLNAGLTEGAAARILTELGVRTMTSRPDGSVSDGRADQLATLAGSSAIESSTVPDSIGLPTQCLELRNRGMCNDCCNAAVGCDPSTGCGSTCAKFCKSVLPPGKSSPDEPQP